MLRLSIRHERKPMLRNIKKMITDPTGAITMEYVFNSLIGISVAGVLFFFIKSPAFGSLLVGQITDFITGAVGSLFHW